MNYIKKIALIGLLLCFFHTTYAFTVHKIEFQGLQRITQETALSYLPVRVGEDLTTAKTNSIIQALYKTGFFTEITLDREGDTLIVKVKERPTISEVNVTGNDEIPQDKLNDALKNLGLQQGAIFQNSILEQVKQALIDQYYNGGYYNAKVTTKVTEQLRSRVAIDIEVSEGRIAKVKGITVVGNKAFDEDTLVNQFTLTTPGVVAFFSGSAKYSREALDKSIEALRGYYLDHGYINVRINSQQVTLTPDRKYVYIVVSVTEGEQYKFGSYQITGDLIIPASELQQYVQVVPGQIFSRQKVLDTNKAISLRYEDKGYAYTKVNAEPKVDEKTKTVNLNFKVEPGSRYYIRRINFDGNATTTNIALRNYFTQMEGSQYSKSKIETSMRNLRQLPYLQEQELSYGLQPVEGTNDELDLNMKVKEALSAQFQFNIGYSQAQKFMISTSVTQQNFMGTGKTVGVTLQGSAYSQVYSINYTNPFFTPDGVSHSMSVYLQRVDAAAVSIADFSTSAYGFNDSYGFPLSNYDSFNLGYGLQSLHLLVGSAPSTQMSNFENSYGDMFHQLLLSAGWNHNSTDRYRLPTAGDVQGLNGVISVPIDQKKLEYYTITYNNRWYLPLTNSHNWIFTTLVNLGYGNGYGSFSQLPFFQNFYAGGLGVLGQVRGYTANSLGPRDSLGNNIGGNALVDANMGLIIPNPAQDHGLRTTWFVDAGNVYNTQIESVNLRQLSYSTGLQLEWWTPLGIPLIFSFATPIHQQAGDETEFFQFTLGGSF